MSLILPSVASDRPLNVECDSSLAWSASQWPQIVHSMQVLQLVGVILQSARLDPSVLTNYWPICNLSIISKILERHYLFTSSLTPLLTTSICLPITPFNRDRTHPYCQRHVWGCWCQLCNRTCSTRPISSIWYHRSRRSSQQTFGYFRCYQVTGTALNFIKSYITC